MSIGITHIPQTNTWRDGLIILLGFRVMRSDDSSDVGYLFHIATYNDKFCFWADDPKFRSSLKSRITFGIMVDLH